MAGQLADHIALVTGASRGIGAAVALALARSGAHVLAVARTVGGLEELDDQIRAAGGSATLVPLDLRDGAGIDRLGGVIHERYGRLDIMVGNAGMLGPLSPVGHVQPSAWDEVIAINLTANFRLIRSMDPLLRVAAAGRVVLVSSGVAATCRAYWGPYAISKSGLEALARTYANETSNTQIRVNVVNPGPTRTRMRAQAMPGEDPNTLDTPEGVADKIVELCLPSFVETGKLYDHPKRTLTAFGCAIPVSSA
jgi:NAD(P)-dependent dehydrogenase (short-subunit alcohol dehydrogenase family)